MSCICLMQVTVVVFIIYFALYCFLLILHCVDVSGYISVYRVCVCDAAQENLQQVVSGSLDQATKII